MDMGLIWIVVIGSSIGVWLDAGKIMPSKEELSKKIESGKLTLPVTPLGWMVGCILLWIIFFPLYLFKRDEYKKIDIKVNKEKSNVNIIKQSNYLDELEKLDLLRKKGIITEEEFQLKKKNILELN